MSEYGYRPVPKNWNEPTDKQLQVHPRYTLTDQDILRLYGLFTPQEIYDQFRWDGPEITNCRAVRSIYRLIRRYSLDSPSIAKKHLKKRLMAYVPEGHTVKDWDNITEETLAVAKAEAVAEIEKGDLSLRRMDTGFQPNHPEH